MLHISLPTTTNYTYDAAGRMTSNGANTLTWDRANRLLSYNGSSYAYDGEGNRIQQIVGANTTNYLLDGTGLMQVLAATTGANTTRYIHTDVGMQHQQDSAGNWQ